MSGHSKWANIKRQKQATDIVRSKVFTKLGNAITIIVHESGGNTDPNSNFKLRLAIEKAKAVNMPKTNIERAIKRAVGKNDKSEQLSEVVYEGFVPHGIAVLVEAVTDNKQRTAALIKNLFVNFGGSLSGVGSVAYLFQKIGELHLGKENYVYDKILELALDTGADDIEEENDRFVVICKPQNLHQIKEFFESKNIRVLDSELTYKPITSVEVAQNDSQKIISLLTALDDLEEVHQVHANFIVKNN